MTRLNPRISPSDRDAVNQAVKNAESRTCAEIIPVIAVSSGRYDRSEDIAGLWLGLLCFLFVWRVLPTETGSGSWSAPAPVWQFVAYAVSILAGFVVGAIVASRFDGLRRLLTPQQQMRDEVSARARQVFFDQRVHHTTGSTGILLYVSLLERTAAVLADQSIVEQLGQSRVDAICTEFTGRLRTNTPIEALTATIHSAGTQLAELLPRTGTSLNELSDALVVIGEPDSTRSPG